MSKQVNVHLYKEDIDIILEALEMQEGTLNTYLDTVDGEDREQIQLESLNVRETKARLFSQYEREKRIKNIV